MYSPYQCANVINNIFKTNNIQKQLPPQMFYTYTKKNYINNTTVNGKVKVSHEDLMVWFKKYTTKNNINININDNDENIDENQLELEI